MIKFTALFLLLPFNLFAVRVTIVNDSPYELEARIYDPNNQVVGSSTLPANGHYYSWTDSYHGASDWTEGPFTIRFFCPTGEEYGRITHVADGTTARARGATGHRRCGRTAPPPREEPSFD